jgi:large subunit ribosomal protein L31
MKKDIHPNYTETKVTCSCGNTFVTRSTAGKELRPEICSNCHPFYTGKQKVADTKGRVGQFQEKYANKSAEIAAAKEKTLANKAIPVKTKTTKKVSKPKKNTSAAS